ncbi:MAG: hypothetical protein PHF99_12805, partial [Bacteroidales bacterium]|nr:hypothetical protein [Bacteroidales bacterium]
MKNIIVKFSLVVFISLSALYVHSQCTNTTSYGSATAPTDNTPVTITTVQYESEYNTISNVVAGETYQSSSDCGSYITVRRGTYDGTVVDHGWSPLSWTATVSGTYYIHYNTDAACGTASTFCTTTITCTSCGGAVCSNCSNPHLIPSGTTFPFSHSGTTCGACNNYSSSDACGTSYMNGEDFVYEYTPSSNVNISVDLTTDASWVGVIVTQGCPDVGTCVGIPATSSGANASGGPYSLSAGVTYYFSVSTWPTPNCIPSYTLTLTDGVVTPPPPNNLCANATTLPCGTTNLAGTTNGATDIAHGTGCTMSNYGVWYTFTGDGDETTITSTAASGYDHEMAIASGSCGSLTNISCHDSGASGGTESVNFTTTLGVQYYVYIAHYSSGSTTTGNFTISRSCGNVIVGSENCEDAMAVCAEEGVGINFGAQSNDPYIDAPADQCSFLRNPTWWYFQIESLGYIEMEIASSCGDVDFACYGPFDNITCDPLDLTGSGSYTWYDSGNSGTTYTGTYPCVVDALALPSGNLADASYSIDATEILNINPVSVGEYYVVIIGNYANCDGVIDFNQTNIGDPGAGGVDCDIVSDCSITSISATTACTGTTFTLTGEIFFSDAPADGTLTICDGVNCQTFYPPFTSPTPYTLTNLSADGLQHQLT